MERRPGRNGGSLVILPKGTSGNPKGGPRKFVSQLREHGYKVSEVNDALQVLLAMNEAELRGVIDHKDATMLEKIAAKALLKDYQKGYMFSLESLLSRVYGKPREQVFLEQHSTITEVKINIHTTTLPPTTDADTNRGDEAPSGEH